MEEHPSNVETSQQYDNVPAMRQHFGNSTTCQLCGNLSAIRQRASNCRISYHCGCIRAIRQRDSNAGTCQQYDNVPAMRKHPSNAGRAKIYANRKLNSLFHCQFITTTWPKSGYKAFYKFGVLFKMSLLSSSYLACTYSYSCSSLLDSV